MSILKSKYFLLFAYIGIFLCILVFSLSTYAYVTIKLVGENETSINMSVYDKEIEVTFIDTSNVSMVNAYTGQKLIKTFTNKNTGKGIAYYDIKLDSLVNDFANKNDLVYTLSSKNGAYVSETVVPSIDTVVASNIKIDKGDSHEYELVVTFLKTDEDQSNNMNRTFSSKVKIESSKGINSGEEIYKEGTLGRTITDNLTGGINSDNYLNNVDGIYYTNNSRDGKTIYFYRGSKNLNNNVVFGDYCYKILRTTDSFGIKLVYSGKYENNKCISGLIDTKLTYNSKSGYNAYVGYMYGSVSSDNYASEHKNNNSSEIKKYLDNWYNDNIKDYDEYIDYDSSYCNNRQMESFKYSNVFYDKFGYSDFNTGYQMMLDYYMESGNKISYECNKDDEFSVSEKIGNNNLNYPIGLLTAEELYYAGFEPNSNKKARNYKTLNMNNFLYIKGNYYTMSSAYFNGQNAYVFAINGNTVVPTRVNTLLNIRPVITVDRNIKILDGDGSNNNPYILTKQIEKSEEE